MTTFFNGNTQFQTTTLTVENGQTTSDALNCNGQGMIGLIMPAALTSTALTFTGSQDNSTFTAFYNTQGVQLTVACAASRIILFTPGDLIGLQYIKLVMGSAEGGRRSIQAITRTFY